MCKCVRMGLCASVGLCAHVQGGRREIMCTRPPPALLSVRGFVVARVDEALADA